MAFIHCQLQKQFISHFDRPCSSAMKISSLFLIALGFVIACTCTQALQHLRGDHATRLEAHAHQTVQHAAIQHHSSPKMAKMEARAHQNSAKISVKVPKMEAHAHQTSAKASGKAAMAGKMQAKITGGRMEAKSAQKLVGFAQAVANGQNH